MISQSLIRDGFGSPRNGFVKNNICVLPEKIEALEFATKKIEFISLQEFVLIIF